MSRAHNIRKVGGKIIGTFSLWETAENLMRISSSPNLREKFSASILDVVEQLQLDGLFLKWMWPGCPMVVIKLKVDAILYGQLQTMHRAETANLSILTKATPSNSFLPSANN